MGAQRDPRLAVRIELARQFGLTKLEALCVDPVDGARPWGLVVGRNPFVAKAGENDASFTTRDGWRVTYANWESDAASGQTRPKRIDLTRSTTQAGKVAIRIAIDGWKKP